MKALGIDVGSLTTEAVILEEDVIITSSVIPSGDEAELSARAAMKKALEQAGLAPDNHFYIVSTGVGGKSISLSQLLC